GRSARSCSWAAGSAATASSAPPTSGSSTSQSTRKRWPPTGRTASASAPNTSTRPCANWPASTATPSAAASLWALPRTNGCGGCGDSATAASSMIEHKFKRIEQAPGEIFCGLASAVWIAAQKVHGERAFLGRGETAVKGQIHLVHQGVVAPEGFFQPCDGAPLVAELRLNLR